ncbi:MAG: hypothetical protein GY742_00705 [Hyphomicrobiales bacterium]|nr:hypothetical protein [Hyphomicrobiales bacterium]
MATSVKREPLRFTDGLMDYLQLVDYRLAESAVERENIYQFRYHSYLRENLIEENQFKRFCDDYDQMDNCWTFGVDHHHHMVSSIRIHVATGKYPRSPTLDVFPDIVGPMLEDGNKIIDLTRFVTDPSATSFSSALPFLTMRLIFMACEYFEADYCLAPVSVAHSPFYRRVFGLTKVAEPRQFHQLLKTPLCLMQGDLAKILYGLIDRYPVFRSTFTERRMLFERPMDIYQGANDRHLQVV